MLFLTAATAFLAMTLGQPPQGEPGVRSLGECDASEMYGNPTTGTVAVATREGYPNPRHFAVVFGSKGRLSKTRIRDEQRLIGIGTNNRPVTSSLAANGERSYQFGDVTVGTEGGNFIVKGRVSGEFYDPGFVTLAPLLTRGIVVIDGGRLSKVELRSGPNLEERRFVSPVFRGQKLRVYGLDLSCTAINPEEIALYVNPDDLPKDVSEMLPRLGIRFSPPATQIYRKCLAVMSLKTGECVPLMLVETVVSLLGSQSPRRNALASIGEERVLLPHDGFLLVVDTKFWRKMF